jgi:NAD(P)-dependent dehydrogenase (short-subunit alcohol dehydrogenase family)
MANRVVIVTGGGRGIGRAVCQRFASDGDQVVAAARSADELEETRASIESSGGLCCARKTDITDADQVEALIHESVEKFGRADVLVNCAGVAALATVEELDVQTFDNVVAVNMRAIYTTCRAVWPTMRKQGGGVIVNISSMASVDPFPGFAAYGASKAWVNLWSKALAEEGRSHGIRVFAVAPGAVETKMLRDAFPDFPADQTLDPSDVAGVIHAISQPSCQYATGQCVFVK